MFRIFSIVFALLMAVLPLGALNAQSAEGSETVSQTEIPATAHATIELVSEQLIGMLGDAKERFDADPDSLYADVDSVISPWLDFGRWSRSVMGREYVAKATEEQLQAFEQVFRTSLIQTYAKGLINVEDTGYEIDPPRSGDEQKNVVPVIQTLYSGADSIKLMYTMYSNDDGRWQVGEVNMEGTKMRALFQGQFKGAISSNGGDIDKVIATWGS